MNRIKESTTPFVYIYEKEERLDRMYLKKINTNKYIWRQRGRRKKKNKEETEVDI